MGDIAIRKRLVRRWGVCLAVLWLLYGCSSGRQQQARVAPPPSRPVASTEVSQPAEIRALELREEGEVAYLDIVADRALVWTNYRDSLGNLVVELTNSEPGAAVGDLVTESGLVASVEIEELEDAERPLTRLVVRTREDSEHSLTTEGATLQLQLLPVGYEEPVALAYQPPSETGSETGGAAPAPRDPRSFGTADAPLKGPVVSGVAASQLFAVDVLEAGDNTVVHVAGDGEFSYSTFRLENPARFVIDLTGVLNTSDTSSVDIGSDLVDRVRIGQFKTRPDPVSRVVFDLRSGILPRIERGADGLTVTFGTAMAEIEPEPEIQVAEQPPSEEMPAFEETPSAEAQTQVAEQPAPAPPPAEMPAFEEAPPSEEVPVYEEGETQVAQGETEAEEPLVEEFDPMPPPVEDVPPPVIAQAPPPLPPPAPPAAQPSPPRGTVRDISADSLEFEAQEAQGIETQDEQPLTPAGFESVTVSHQTRVYTGEPINMSLKNADLVETLRSFASISGLNFVIQPGVSGSVTVELKGVPWDQAMEQILKINNLGTAIDGTIVRIAPAEQLREEAQRDREIALARRRTIPLRTVMKQLSYADANEVSTLLRNRSGAILSDRGTVQVDRRTNSLIIRELPNNIDVVLAVIENLDTAEPQVTIEARIIEATKNFGRSLGIQWGFDALADNPNGNTTGLQFPNNYDIDGGVGLLTGGANGFLNLTMGNILNTFNLNARLQAAENEGLINIISAPSVTTLNNFPAFIQSGLQIPIQTVSNRTVSVQFVNATLQLTVQPHVTAEGTIILRLDVAKRSPQLAFAVVGAQNAPIATKQANTTVVVRDGGTAVIGGIYEVSTDQSQDRVPGLANIPIIGHLFRNRSRNESNDELMIFVTPRIVQM